jgi:hypothetical protein
MGNNIQVSIDSDVFKRLQEIATPLVDDVNTVIKKLINLWEEKEKKSVNPQVVDEPAEKYWVDSRGASFLVGLKLRASYYNQKFDALITDKGISFLDKVFDSPSAAAMHAKRVAGAKSSSICTNGWKFWEYFDAKKGRWLQIDDLRN